MPRPRHAQDFGAGEKNPNLITPEKYNELVKKHVMFKDMAADTYLASAGIADDWPYGRGCWQSDDKQCIVWFGEEDQLRIMCMKRGTKLNEVFDRLKKMLDTIESIDGIGRELCGNQPVNWPAWNFHVIKQTQLRRKYRVDGVGRPKFDFHTGLRNLIEVRLRHVVPVESRYGHARVGPRENPEPHGRRHGDEGQGSV